MYNFAFPVMVDHKGSFETHWRVWRPDRNPHLHGKYKTESGAQKSADKINLALKAIVWNRQELPNGTIRYRFYRNGQETPYFIDCDRRCGNSFRYQIYGSGMSPKGFAAELGGSDSFDEAVNLVAQRIETQGQ